MGLAILLVAGQQPANLPEFQTMQANSLVLDANVPPDLVTRSRTKSFIDSIRNIKENNASSLDRIFYRVGALIQIDPDLSNLTQSMKDYLISQVLSFENTNGGFGDWKRDRSSVSATFKAVQVLNWLGYANLNTTKVKGFLDRLFVAFSGKFKTYLSDTDGDIYATSLAVLTYNLLGEPIFSSTQINDSLVYAQNLNPASVPNVEIGGYGLQTNSLKGIYWTSTVVHSAYAIEAIFSYGGSLANTSAAITFLQGMQLSTGGFADSPYLANASVAYTERALTALNLLGSGPVDPVKVENFIHSLQTADGGYRLKPTSVDSSLKGTYYALKSLSVLNKQSNNITGVLDFLMNLPFMQDGFGANPEDEPSLRETFDAVMAYGIMGQTMPDPTGLLAYVERYRNQDNGFGLTQSYAESTFRAVSIYHELGVEIPNKAGVISFLQSLQQADGGFAKSPTATQSYVISTYRSIAALDLLGAAPLNRTAAIDFLKSTQQADGGFGGFVGDISDVSSTYRAVRALNILGDMTFNVAKAVEFLKSSQVADGGFKRSVNDVVLPNNVSHAVYTYAAVRALDILNATPSNITGVYNHIRDLRNNDGGYGKHADFTSDIAYTFTSLYVLSILPKISNLAVELPVGLDQKREQYDNFTIQFLGGIPLMNYSIEIDNSSQLLASGSLTAPASVIVDTTALSVGMHVLRVEYIDQTKAMVNQTFSLLISNEIVTSQPTDTGQPTNTSQPTDTAQPTNT
ncbi:MAG: hypothetical protein D6732_24965, partial [Methanobacteriota archaeon]